MRQYSLVLFVSLARSTHGQLDLRLVSRTGCGYHFWVVVKDLEKGVDDRVRSSGVLDVAGTVLVELSLGVVESGVGTPLSSIGTKVAEVRVQWIDDRSARLIISYGREARKSGVAYTDEAEERGQLKT